VRLVRSKGVEVSPLNTVLASYEHNWGGGHCCGENEYVGSWFMRYGCSHIKAMGGFCSATWQLFVVMVVPS